jgi:hypothetical protein
MTRVIYVNVSQLLFMAPVPVSVNEDQSLFTACVIVTVSVSVSQPLRIALGLVVSVKMN